MQKVVGSNPISRFFGSPLAEHPSRGCGTSMQPMRRLGASLATLPILLIAGCGGADEQAVAVATGPELTKSEWIEQADKICATSADDGSLEAEYDRLRGEPASQKVQRELAEVFRTGGAEVEEMAERLRLLRPPADDQQVVERFLSGVEKIATSLTLVADATEDTDLATTEKEDAWGDLILALLRASSQAQRYGLRVCGAES